MPDYSFDLSSADADILFISRVRDEIDDVTSEGTPVEGKHYFLTNARILSRRTGAESVTSGEWNLVWQTAASCLDTLATNQAYVEKVGSTLGESYDGAKVAEAIRAHAKELRQRVATSEAKAEEAATASVATGGTVRTARGCTTGSEHDPVSRRCR